MSWRSAEDVSNDLEKLERDFPVGSEVRIDGEVGTVTGHELQGSTPMVLVQFQGQNKSVPVGRRGLQRSSSSMTKGPIGGRKKRTRRVKPRATRKRKHVRKA